MSPADSGKCQSMKTGNGFNANDPSAHNYGFTIEAEKGFKYHGGEYITFSGGDDFWLYIDGKLVGDLGGVHERAILHVSLDDIAKSNGWEYGSGHELKFFFAQRQTPSSNFELTTNINDWEAPRDIPPMITKAITVAGQYDLFSIITNTPLSQETIDEVNRGNIPDLIVSNFADPTIAKIERLENHGEFFDEEFGNIYQVTVNSSRPNPADSISFNPSSNVKILDENGRSVTKIRNQIVEFSLTPEPGPNFNEKLNVDYKSFNDVLEFARLNKSARWQIFNLKGKQIAINDLVHLKSGMFFIKLESDKSFAGATQVAPQKFQQTFKTIKP